MLMNLSCVFPELSAFEAFLCQLKLSRNYSQYYKNVGTFLGTIRKITKG